MNVTLVDASLYTAPYDAALTRGLIAAGVRPAWTTRPTRRGERSEIPAECVDAFFYRRVDEASWLPGVLRPVAKGCAHAAGVARLVYKVWRDRPDVVHMQWIVVPVLDALGMALIRRWCPLVLTVHDTLAYNGQRMPWLQEFGRRLPVNLADRLIVHTRSGRQALLRCGVPGARISVIPHGPLALPDGAAAPAAPTDARDARWTMVLFGEIKPYKGLDILIEAVAALPPPLRRQLRVVVAGRPRMDLAPLIRRIDALGVAGQFDLRLKRLSEDEMAGLFAQADGFVFPYRQIDASGVYYLVSPLGKWLIASRIGVFAEELGTPAQGALVPPGDVPALARALEHAVAERPCGSVAARGTTWNEIGRATRALYERARDGFER